MSNYFVPGVVNIIVSYVRECTGKYMSRQAEDVLRKHSELLDHLENYQDQSLPRHER